MLLIAWESCESIGPNDVAWVAKYEGVWLGTSGSVALGVLWVRSVLADDRDQCNLYLNMQLLNQIQQVTVDLYCI